MSWYREWRPYIPVAQRRAKAATYAARLAKKENRTLAPVILEGRKIACSFWGQAWCENLERYSDFANRLPRGRTYVRNRSVIDLQIERGQVKAIVSGSEIYQVTITIDTLPEAKWKRIKQDCARSIDSLIDLLRGRFDQGVMQRLTERESGLFPQPKEIKLKCSCPDWATMCKHVAAVLYGVGARLDSDPELLFALRDVDHLELIGQAVAEENLNQALTADSSAGLEGADLSEMFGIDIDPGASNGSTPVAVAAEKPSREPQAVSKQSRSKRAEVKTKAIAGSKNKHTRKPKSSEQKSKLKQPRKRRVAT
jgi:uncharacterized Zn finger protein